MKIIFQAAFGLMLLFALTKLQAQGPPISGDKPIMLGAKAQVVKNTNEYRKTTEGWYMHNVLKYHYIINKNLLVAVHLPWATAERTAGDDPLEKTSGFGDLAFVVKPQFFRKDGKAKTFRMAGKLMQTFPTGVNLGEADISFKGYKTHVAIVAGYETLKYGILGETGYRYQSGDFSDQLVSKFGIGLPLLKPTYPVKQINLYFQYESVYNIQDNRYKLFYGQGIQLAYDQFTIDFEVQIPLIQTEGNHAHHTHDHEKRLYSLVFGGRYIF